MGKAGDSFKDIAEKKRFAVGVMQESEKAEFGKGGKGDGRHINADRLRRGEKDTKIIIENVDGGHAGVSGDNGMEEGSVRIQTVRLRLVRGLSKPLSQIPPTSYPCLSQRQRNAKRRDGDKRE